MEVFYDDKQCSWCAKDDDLAALGKTKRLAIQLFKISKRYKSMIIKK